MINILCPVCKKDITNKIAKNNDCYTVRCIYYNITNVAVQVECYQVIDTV